MEQTKNAEIDFDTWSEVARSDPDAFERMRLEAIQAVIDDAPAENRERLRRLQWRIDQERRLAHTPLNACLRISRLMWRNVLGPGGLQERFGELQRMFGSQPNHMATDQSQPGEVVAFARARD